MRSTITLTPIEHEMALVVAKRRQTESERKGLHNKNGLPDGDSQKELSLHQLGACGELAAAKFLNLYWGGCVNTFHAGDISTNIQVRTRSKDHYDLLVRDNDRDSDIFILVLGQRYTFRIAGWLYGYEAKEPMFQQTHSHRPPAYFIPQGYLRQFADNPRADLGM